jgi:hypothetical protein
MVTLPGGRRGRGNLGCLVSLLLLAAFIYLAIAFGRPWFAYQQYQEEMQTILSMHHTLSDSAMTVRARARADSLRLPPEARRIILEREANPPRLTMRAEYQATVDLPLLGPKVLTFRPEAEEEL